MPLSRLENFLVNTDGNILYVNPSDLDATDSFDNKGNSLTRPFVSIQRALLEAARFSYQTGEKNDRYDKTTILLYPGTHYIDNRPGYYIENNAGSVRYYDVNKNTISDVLELTNNSNFDLNNAANILYKFNSVDGGAVIPKGTSIVGLDLRKTKVKPLYVPNAEDITMERAALFRVTGGCYFWQFSIFDADKSVYYSKDFSQKGTFKKSHHKLTCFEYADGINTKELTGITDLAMYYYKVMNAYGDDTGNREITDYPGATDFEPNSPEYKIVGDLSSDALVIDKITASGVIASVDTPTNHNLNVDDSVRISGISSELYNGSRVVTGITSDRKFTYLLSSAPIDASITPSQGRVIIEADNVTGSSPYIFNCSLRSVYGMCGLHADGTKATGFKSMVVAQFTGIGLQKDDNAFLIYNPATGTYNDKNSAPTTLYNQPTLPLYINQEAVYNPTYGTYHIRASNDAFIQAVSVFAIGFSNHFLSESGSDQSITNSNSNFGAKSLISKGFRKDSFNRDNTGYVTHIVPPKDLREDTFNVSWKTIDAEETIGAATTSRLYLLGEKDLENPPSNVSNGYRVGSKTDEKLYLNVNLDGINYTHSTPVNMQAGGTNAETIAQKRFVVNTIDSSDGTADANDSITLFDDHNFVAGESVRVYSDDGRLPDGIESEKVYYVITISGQPKVIKLAKSLNVALDIVNGNSTDWIDIKNTNGGTLTVVSYVTDKVPGDIGHPVQWDTTRTNWYITGAGTTSSNTIYNSIVGYSTQIAANNSATYFQRKSENRDLNDRIYRLRYVIPKEFANAKAPEKNYVLQESSTTGITVGEEITISSIKSNRNSRIVSGITTSNLVATVTTEDVHKLSVGDRVKLDNVKSTLNTDGTKNLGFNGYYYVVSTPSTKTFTYNLTENPGTFTNNMGVRTNDELPTLSRNEYDTSYTIQNVDTVQEYISGQQDGVFYLTCIIGNVSPTASQFVDRKFKQNILNLYPTVDIDNLDVDPIQGISVADNKSIGKVIVNDTQNSITKEGIIEYLKDNAVGYAVTGAFSTGTAGISTVYSKLNHNLNSITALTLTVAGTGYPTGSGGTTLYSVELINEAGGMTGEGATADLTVNASGVIQTALIKDGGAAYGVGNTMRISGGTSGVVSVAAIDNTVGKVIQVVGVGTDKNRTNSKYNGLYKVSAVPTANTVAFDASYGAGSNNPGIYTGSKGMFYVVDKALSISGIAGLANTTLAGIATITTSTSHGLSVGNRIKIVNVSGSASSYNQDHVVTSIGSTTTFSINAPVGVTTTGISTAEAYRYGLTALGEDTSLTSEKIAGSLLSLDGSIKTELTSNITDVTNPITVNSTVGFSTGDFLQINNEVLRVKRVTSATQLEVLPGSGSRVGQMGTKQAAHVKGAFVRKIEIIPSEVRRFSSIRASGHTFEYVGYGPGNYSTALPQLQRRSLTSEEEILAISTEEKGGVVFYSGMNDRGEFFSGERVEPRELFLGGDSGDGTVVFDDVYIRNTLRVGGGPNRNLPSEFRGPVNFTNKITSTAKEGIQAIKILLQGNPTQNPSLQVGPDAEPSLYVAPTADGFVGIKKADPAYELDVNGAIRATTYENFKLTDLPIGVNEESTYARNRILKVKDDGTGYELIDPNELQTYALRSFGVSNDPTVYVGIGTTVGGKMQISGISTARWHVGQYAKVFGVGGHGDTPPATPSASIIRIPATEIDMGPKKYNYWVAQYERATGNVGAAVTVNAAGIAHTTITNMNLAKHIQLTINRSSTSMGALVYRQEQESDTQPSPGIATDFTQAKLIAILGPKELGPNASGSQWKDYGTYPQTHWGGKGTVNEFDDDQIHFPNIGTTGFRRGWAIDSVVEVGTNNITLSGAYGTNGNIGFGTNNSVKVVHDSTHNLMKAIDRAVLTGGNYLEVPSGTYLTNKLIVPSGFTLQGAGKNTIIKQQYFAQDATDGAGNSLSEDGNFVGIGTTMGPQATATPTDVTFRDITFDGNAQNNILFEATTDNYLLYMGSLRSSLFKGIEVRNSPGDGMYLPDSQRVSIEDSAFVDGGLTDIYPFRPVVAAGSTSLRINDCLFENFPGPVDVSVTSIVSTGGNIIRNCGSGLDAYATGKITTTNNIILGPSDEWIPSPDIYDSDWNSVNVNIPITSPQTDFEGPMMLFVEDGLAKNVASTKVEIVAGIGTLVGMYSTTAQPTLGNKFVNFQIKPDNVTPNDIDREHGYVKLTLTASQIKDKLTIANAPTETGAGLTGITTALGYEVVGTEFMEKPVGYTTYVGIGTGKWFTSVDGSPGAGNASVANTCYYVHFADANQYAGISTGDVVQLTNHDVNPDLSSYKFTVAEKKITAGISSLRLEPTTLFPTTATFQGANVTDGILSGYISIRRTFTIAKGRVGVI